MNKNKDAKKEKVTKKQKSHVSPADIKGKLELPDTRERRDGPGGN